MLTAMASERSLRVDVSANTGDQADGSGSQLATQRGLIQRCPVGHGVAQVDTAGHEQHRPRHECRLDHHQYRPGDQPHADADARLGARARADEQRCDDVLPDAHTGRLPVAAPVLPVSV